MNFLARFKRQRSGRLDTEVETKSLDRGEADQVSSAGSKQALQGTLNDACKDVRAQGNLGGADSASSAGQEESLDHRANADFESGSGGLESSGDEDSLDKVAPEDADEDNPAEAASKAGDESELDSESELELGDKGDTETEAEENFGPYSRGESPSPQQFFDLGALRIPIIEGVQVAPILNAAHQVQALEIIAEAAQMQVAPFAMQRSGGLWDQILSDLTTQLEAQGYQIFPLPSPYGEALLARPAESSEIKKAGAMSMLIWGIEGERWLLRVIFRGAAAEEESARAGLLKVLHRLEVVRGEQAMAPGDLLEIKLPAEIAKKLASLAPTVKA